MQNDEVWQLWDYKGPIEGCLTEHGCLDTRPALNWLDDTMKEFPDGYKRRVTVASVDVNTGDYIEFN